MDIINNMNVVFNINKIIPLDIVKTYFPQAQINRKLPWCTLKIENKCLIINPCGKINVTGVICRCEAYSELKKFLDKIQIKPERITSRIVNITACYTHNFHLKKLIDLNVVHGEPELFPGFYMKMPSFFGNAVVTLFHSGSITITGVKDIENLEYIIDYVNKRINEYE